MYECPDRRSTLIWRLVLAMFRGCDRISPMTRYLLFCLLLANFTGASVRGGEPLLENPAYLIKVGLDTDAPASAVAPAESNPCQGVTFSRNLKYDDGRQSMLDVATDNSEGRPALPRPVLLFVAGQSFSTENGEPDAQAAMRDAAMCFAARHGMVGVSMRYGLAPADPWPSGARYVAAATSWLHQNIDLYGGDRGEIIAVGYAVGAFHVASLLAHPEFDYADSSMAAAILISGIYSVSADADADEKSYFGPDAAQYNQRSAFPGILDLDTPLLLAWSTQDPPGLVAQGRMLNKRLCDSLTHCARTIVLGYRESLASVFEDDAPGGGLVQPTLELVQEIEARGLP
jgi:acetyl esterase/lipase